MFWGGDQAPPPTFPRPIVDAQEVRESSCQLISVKETVHPDKQWEVTVKRNVYLLYSFKFIKKTRTTERRQERE